MAKRAGHADPRQHVLAIDGFDRTLEADHRVQLQEHHRGVGAFQIDGPVLDARHDRRRQGFDSTFKPTDSAVLARVNGGADHFMHAKRVGPLRLVAKGVEAEDLLALCNRGLILCIRVTAAGAAASRLLMCTVRCGCQRVDACHDARLSRPARRARCVLLWSEGERRVDIRDKLACNDEFVTKWTSAFETQGLAGLVSLHPGRAPKVPVAKLDARVLNRTLKHLPKDGSTHWSSRKRRPPAAVDNSAPMSDPQGSTYRSQFRVRTTGATSVFDPAEHEIVAR